MSETRTLLSTSPFRLEFSSHSSDSFLDGISRTVIGEFKSPLIKVKDLIVFLKTLKLSTDQMQQLSEITINSENSIDIYNGLLKKYSQDLSNAFEEHYLQLIPPLDLPESKRKEMLENLELFSKFSSSDRMIKSLKEKMIYRPVDAQGIKLLHFINEVSPAAVKNNLLPKLVETGHQNAILFLLSKCKLEQEQFISIFNKSLEKGKLNVVKYFLDEYKIDLNSQYNGQFTLITAVKLGYSECVKLLIYHGARTDIVDSEEKTPLIHAAQNNDVTTATILLQRKETDVNAKDNEGHSAIWLALQGSYDNKFICDTNYAVMIGLLLQNGADVTMKDKEGVTLQEFVTSFEEEWEHGLSWSGRLNLKYLLASQQKLSTQVKSETDRYHAVINTVKKDDYKNENDFIYAQVRSLLEDYFAKKSDPILQILEFRQNKDFFDSIIANIKKSDLGLENGFPKSFLETKQYREYENREFKKAQNKSFLKYYFEHNKAGHKLDDVVGIHLQYKDEQKDKRPVSAKKLSEMNSSIEEGYFDKISTAIDELENIKERLNLRKKAEKGELLTVEERESIRKVPQFQEMMEYFERHDWVNYCPGLVKALLFARMNLGNTLSPQPQELERFVSHLAMS